MSTEQSRPVVSGAADEKTPGDGLSHPTLAELEGRAALELRLAWLTAHGHLMFGVDDSGLISAQLWDLRDLLEACAARGCWK